MLFIFLIYLNRLEYGWLEDWSTTHKSIMEWGQVSMVENWRSSNLNEIVDRWPPSSELADLSCLTPQRGAQNKQQECREQVSQKSGQLKLLPKQQQLFRDG